MEKVNLLWLGSTMKCINLVIILILMFILNYSSLIFFVTELQGRFEQVQPVYDYYPTPNATFLTAIAVKDNVSSVVEFRVRPFAASWRYQMYVLVDKEYIFWWDESMRVQNFYGVTLYQPAGIKNMSHIIAMFDSGAGVEVTSYKGRLTLHVYAPYTFLVSIKRDFIQNLFI